MPSLTLRLGGLTTKEELLLKLREAEVQLNAYATEFIGDSRFELTRKCYELDIEILSLAELGLVEGGTYAQLLALASAAGLHPCPPEAGPHLRLQCLDQLEDHRVDARALRAAPRGSITVASNPLTEDDEFPKGLYLRRLHGSLWLRGYRSWQGHLWSPDDVFAFSCSPCSGPELNSKIGP